MCHPTTIAIWLGVILPPLGGLGAFYNLFSQLIGIIVIIFGGLLFTIVFLGRFDSANSNYSRLLILDVYLIILVALMLFFTPDPIMEAFRSD